MDLSPTSAVCAEKEPELRIVLLGKTGVGKSAAAKTILGKKPLKSHPWFSSVALFCEKKTNVYAGLNLDVIDTPFLFRTIKSNKDIVMEIAKGISMAAPGPLVFLIVLQPTRFTPEDEKVVELIKKMLGEEAARYTMVLFTHGDELRKENTNIEDLLEKHQPLKHIISQCSILEKFEDKYHVFDNNVEDPAQVSELLEKIQRMVQQNGGSYYSSEMFIESHRAKQEEMGRPLRLTRAAPQAAAPLEIKNVMDQHKLFTATYIGAKNPDRRIVLLGRTGVGKSAAGNTILGGRLFQSRFSNSSVTSVCQRESNSVHGLNLDVVDTPDLFGSNLEYLVCPKQIARCISMAAPGPHVFLIVLQPTRFTPEEKQTVEIIQKMFGEAAAKYTMILFTHGDELKRGYKTMRDLLETSQPLKEIISQCSILEEFEDKYHVFDNTVEDPDQVRGLLQKINRMVQRNGGSFYTNEMFEEAQKAVQEEAERLRRQNPNINPQEARKMAESDNPFIRAVLKALCAAAEVVIGALAEAVAGAVAVAVAAAAQAVTKKACVIQ